MTIHSGIRLGALAPVLFFVGSLWHVQQSVSFSPQFSFFKKKLFWLHWVFIAACTGSVIVAPGLSCPATCGILDPARVPCLGRWILSHWTTREVPVLSFLSFWDVNGPPPKLPILTLIEVQMGGEHGENFADIVMHECSVRGAISPHNGLF